MQKTSCATEEVGSRGNSKFDVEGWTAASPDAMLLAVRHKFQGNPELAALLLCTGDKIIVEAAHYDKIWELASTPGMAKIGVHCVVLPVARLSGRSLLSSGQRTETDWARR